MTSKPRATVKPPQSNAKDLSARRADDESDFVAGSEVDDIDDWELWEITRSKRVAEVERKTNALVQCLNALFEGNTGETKKYLRLVAASLFPVSTYGADLRL